MTDKRPSIDGFVPRRAGSRIGELHDNKRRIIVSDPVDRTLHSGENTPRVSQNVGEVRRGQAIGRSDIDESLREIDTNEESPRLSKRQRRRIAKKSKPRSKAKRVAKWVSVLIIIAIVSIVGYLGFKLLEASGNIFKGSIFDIVQSAPLKEDETGRTNILIFGTSEDDPGHEAAYLTDSIIVLSVDQDKKDAYMFNLPRDLEVEYGTACLSGYRGKINVVYGCNYDDGNDEAAGAHALQKVVGEVTGLDIQYYAHVNYTVVREAVKAVDGIEVNIESRDPDGQMDSNFDWKCGVTGVREYRSAKEKQICPPSGHYIDYPNGIAKLDAEHALYLAQARGDTYPTYGFEQSNFDREKNQQKIIKALREKALDVGTLTNIGKVTGLIDAFGHNLRTDFETKEIRTLMSLGADIQSDKIQSISLIDGDDAVMNGDGNPKAGMYEYGDIQAYIKQELTSDPFVKEKASIAVFNGSGVSGEGSSFAIKLEEYGFVIDSIENAPTGEYNDIEVYVIDAGKTATLSKLKELYPKATIKTTKPPVTVASSIKFVIIVGAVQE